MAYLKIDLGKVLIEINASAAKAENLYIGSRLMAFAKNAKLTCNCDASRGTLKTTN